MIKKPAFGLLITLALFIFTPMINLVIFASGEGSNAERIMEYFKGSATVRITWVVCNNENAGVVQRAIKHKKGIQLISKFVLTNYTQQLISFLSQEKTDLILLAGFLLKIPEEMVDAFPKKIINIHPSLLPKFGGPGMYGVHVHQAVIDAKEKNTGITIHYVNREYDQGEIIFQKSFEIETNETVDSIGEKIKKLEYIHLPEVIERIAENFKK